MNTPRTVFAAHKLQAQLEQLFHKFEGVIQARCLGDSLRLLDLLKKLASSDTSKHKEVRVRLFFCLCFN